MFNIDEIYKDYNNRKLKYKYPKKKKLKKEVNYFNGNLHKQFLDKLNDERQ